MPDRRILVLNAGSSTLKASLLRPGRARPDRAVTIDWDGDPVRVADDALARALAGLGDPPLDRLRGAGHRVVHGGPDLTRPVVIDDGSLAAIEAVTTLAPLHDPPALAVIRALRQRAPDLLQIAAFDTAMHAALPEAARRYPVPDAWHERFGIVRYGFHGLSVEWATGRAAELLETKPSRARIVVAHLGAGSSVTAVDRGRSVWTSMGYTPLEGLMMATRSGSIDPGIVVALVRDGHRTLDAVDDELLHRSGLLGVGGSADLRELLARAERGDDRARLAVAMFEDRAAAAIAAAATRLSRLDAIAFTGGIGEHAAGVRARIVGRLGVLGVPRVDARRRVGDVVRAAGDRQAGRPAVLRIEAREDLVIAAAVEAASRT